jgi:carbon-monoxide dehydrogenase small subunit
MTSLTVNGRAVSANPEPRTHLADFLRDTLLLTGTHLGCEHGVCGACTVLLDGDPVRACLTYPALIDGADIQTVEGLEHDPIAARLRDAFAAEHALQCGYCTPGMLVTARDIVLRLPDADDARIRLELAGNLCRCTGYDGIVRAISRVLDEKPDIASPPRAPIPTARFDAKKTDRTTAAAQTADGLHQRLVFPIPADALWAALHDPALLASCIPGATVDRVEDGLIAGSMQVALGPVRVRLAGEATVRYDEPARTGTISGGGADRGGTRVSASAGFRVVAEGASASTLQVDIEYELRGALSQLARGRVVEMLAGEIGAQFARTLAARLSGAPPEAAAPLRAGSFGWQVLLAWLRSLIRRKP